MPETVKQVLEVDWEMNTDFWRKVLQTEMDKIHPAVKSLEHNVQRPIRYQEIPCHIIFDVKMDFTCRAQYVVGGHTMEDPVTHTYAS